MTEATLADMTIDSIAAGGDGSPAAGASKAWSRSFRGQRQGTAFGCN